MDMVRDMKKTAFRRSFYAFFCLRAGGWVLRRPGGEQVLRLRARDGEFRASARVTFFFCKKKVTKENHSNLRSKDPLARGGFRRCGGEQVLRLRARDGEFRAPARVTFFFCKKKVTKENHSNLRFKDPLARGGQVQIWRCWLRGIGAAGDVVGQKDCACVHRRGGFRDRLPQPR